MEDQKQHTVSRSSAEAKYRALATLICEPKWLKGLLVSFDITHTSSIPVFSDSQSALHLAQNPVYHEKTKHIEVDCHFIRDAILDGTISASHVSTSSLNLLLISSLICYASWTFVTFMLQLEGGC